MPSKSTTVVGVRLGPVHLDWLTEQGGYPAKTIQRLIEEKISDGRQAPTQKTQQEQAAARQKRFRQYCKDKFKTTPELAAVIASTLADFEQKEIQDALKKRGKKNV